MAAQKAAPITLVASGSVVLGHAYARDGEARGGQGAMGELSCATDDWDCYRPAQRNLLARLGAISGCVIVLTGDYHRADIKRIVPGEDAPYATEYYTVRGLAGRQRRSRAPASVTYGQQRCIAACLARCCRLVLAVSRAAL